MPSSAAPVSVQVDAGVPRGAWRPIWNWFGHDEPNYTTMPHGRKLLARLAALHPGPVHLRVHNLLTSGDGTAALKWGSTNAYVEDAAGAPIHSWAILDSIFDAYVELGVAPFVQVGFMPEALSMGPAPYRHDFPRGEITTGWAWPPRDWRRWAELVEAWARHVGDRYGAARASGWLWEIWNEPDGLYWKGSVDEFCRLHDLAADAIRRALPGARVGGPHTCGPTSPRAADFLKRFLAHCQSGTNYATGERGSRLDFVAFHAKGRPELVDGHVRMGIARQLQDIEKGLGIVASFEALRATPVILGESDPEGCAACSTAMRPENAYRDGPLYGAYVVEALARTMELSARAGIEIEGSVTWAFEFEGEPLFAGYRELATNGIDKAVLNAFRMMAMLKGQRLAAWSAGARPLAEVVANGVRGAPDVNVAATREGDEVAILVWHYHDDDLAAPDAAVALGVTGLSGAACIVERFQMDAAHGDAHAAWRAMGAPARPTEAQYAALEAASALPLVEPPSRRALDGGALALEFALPRQGVTLVRLRAAR
ncbi:MAG: beta-xylosidase [Roseiarcus sp.]|jgi:xylan 1,4-beta-xylosidase